MKSMETGHASHVATLGKHNKDTFARWYPTDIGSFGQVGSQQVFSRPTEN